MSGDRLDRIEALVEKNSEAIEKNSEAIRELTQDLSRFDERLDSLSEVCAGWFSLLLVCSFHPPWR